MDIVCQNSRKDRLSCLYLATGLVHISKEEYSNCCRLEVIVMFTFPFMPCAERWRQLSIIPDQKHRRFFFPPYFPHLYVPQSLSVHYVPRFSARPLENNNVISYLCSHPPNWRPFSLSTRNRPCLHVYTFVGNITLSGGICQTGHQLVLCGVMQLHWGQNISVRLDTIGLIYFKTKSLYAHCTVNGFCHLT